MFRAFNTHLHAQKSLLSKDLTANLVANYTSRTCFPLSSTDTAVWLWQQTLLQPELVPVILSGAATHRSATLRLSGAPEKMIIQSSDDSLRLRLQAIASLRQMLTKTPSELTVLFVTQLLGTEVGCTRMSLELFMRRNRIRADPSISKRKQI